MKKILILFLLSGLLVACSQPSVPRPYAYCRITAPEAHYQPLVEKGIPYQFDLSINAELIAKSAPGERYWIDIHYPWCNADIHCSYKSVHNNLRTLTDDAVEFVYKHASQATAIPERTFTNPQAGVYGVLFSINGNTASPYQFFLTDSVSHFFRGAVYCNCRPNADSLNPVHEYLERDIIHLIESFSWK